MRTPAKVLLVVGALFLLIGIVGFGIGLNTVSDVDENWRKFEIENATNGSIQMDDSDGMGELGVTFWVKGEYVDLNNNGIWDVCDSTSVVITENPRINTDWEDAEALDGRFYYEVDYYANGNNSNCDAVENNKNNDLVSSSPAQPSTVIQPAKRPYARGLSPAWLTFRHTPK